MIKSSKIIILLFSAMFMFLLYGCALNESNSSKENPANDKLTEKSSNISDAIVKVDDEYIYHNEIQGVFFQQFGNVGVSYSDIVETSINEIVATSYANKLGVSISDTDIDNAVHEYEAINKKLYDSALKMYGESTLKQKIRDRLLFVGVKNKVLEQEVKIDSDIIKSFKNQKEFHGELDRFSDSELMKRLNNEIKDYAFGLWVKEKRNDVDIQYFKLYDKYKNDFLVFNSSDVLVAKLDGKEKLLDNEEKKKILKSLSVLKNYDAGSVHEVLIKPKNGTDYTERAYIQIHFANNNDNNKTIDIFITDKKEIGIDYKLKDSKTSKLCGVDVELSKIENLNTDDKIVTRATFTVKGNIYMMEGVNIEPFEFTKMVFEVLSKLTDK